MDGAINSRCNWHLIGGWLRTNLHAVYLNGHILRLTIALVCSCISPWQLLTCSFSPPSPPCRRSWSRAPSGTSRAWGWRRLNTGTHSASSCTWPRDSGSPTRHLMSNLSDWVPSRDEWVETNTSIRRCVLRCKAHTNQIKLINKWGSSEWIIILRVMSWLS